MLKADNLKIVHFAPIEPDVVISEIWSPGEKILVELIWGFDGSKRLHLSASEGIDLEAADFVEILSQQMRHLDQWAGGLREPGGAWDPKSSYYADSREGDGP